MKYKIWDYEKKEWFKPTYEAYKGNLEDISMLPDGSLLIRNMWGVSHESMFPGRLEKVFWTGLKDKNWNEIYEGDIFQAFGDKGLNREVLFRDACFGYEEEYMGFIPMKNSNFGWNGGVSQKIEVVGNRFENPELTGAEE